MGALWRLVLTRPPPRPPSAGARQPPHSPSACSAGARRCCRGRQPGRRRRVARPWRHGRLRCEALFVQRALGRLQGCRPRCRYGKHQPEATSLALASRAKRHSASDCFLAWTGRRRARSRGLLRRSPSRMGTPPRARPFAVPLDGERTVGCYGDVSLMPTITSPAFVPAPPVANWRTWKASREPAGTSSAPVLVQLDSAGPAIAHR
jgi:hypothetical protein